MQHHSNRVQHIPEVSATSFLETAHLQMIGADSSGLKVQHGVFIPEQLLLYEVKLSKFEET